HVFHVVVEGVAERDHLDQGREKHEEKRHRIAPDDDEFLEENCAESAKRFAFHFCCSGGISSCLLLVRRMLARELDKYVFERRADFVDLGVTDSDAPQLFVDLCTLDALIDQQMHGLTKHRGTTHAAKLMHGMKSRR